MSIESYIRAKTNYLLRPLIIECECFICKSKEDLHLHHVKPFAIMLKEVHELLSIEYKEYDNYSKKDRDIITTHMLGLQLDSEYLTLCPECHIEEHKKEGQELQSIRNRGMNHVEANRLRKEREEQERIEKDLIPYLINNSGKTMLRPQDRQELIELVNVRNPHSNRLVRGLESINEKLKDYEIPYRVISFRKTMQKNGVREDYHAVWEITPLGSNNHRASIQPNVQRQKTRDGLNVGNIELNARYSYKELLSVLGDEFKSSGRSRNLQFKRWAKHFDMYKPKPMGQSYVVREVYDK